MKTEPFCGILRSALVHSNFSRAAAFALVLHGCASERVEPSESPVHVSEQALATANAAELSYRAAPLDTKRVAIKAQQLSRVIRSEGAGAALVTQNAVESDGTARQALRFDGSPELVGAYDPLTDSIDLRDISVTHNGSPRERDITRDAAKKLFLVAYESLAAQGLFSRAEVSIENVLERDRTAGEGTSDGPSVTWTSEYQFFIPHTVGGFGIGRETHDYGLLLSVHRSGVVVRVALSGLAIADGLRSTGKANAVSVTADEVLRRTQERFPSATIEKPVLKYFLGSFARDAASVVPEYVVSVSPTSIIEGQTVRSKAFTLRYSTSNAQVDPVQWPVPGTPSNDPNVVNKK